MKKVYVLALAAMAFAACNNSGKTTTADEKKVAAADTAAVAYHVVPAETKLGWLGKKVTGQHNGSVAVTEGTLNVKDGAIQSGNFTVDIKSLKVEDETPADMKQKLTGHLLSPDFFHADSFNTAKFEVTNVAPKTDDKGNTHEVSGNLTIKGITRNITFPAKVAVEGDVLKADANIVIDRTEWDIRYGSGKFYKDLADKAIYDNIDFTLALVAKK